jgi:hypothetical protein
VAFSKTPENAEKHHFLAEIGSFLVKNRQKFNKTAEDAEDAEEYRSLRYCVTSTPFPLSLPTGRNENAR